MIRFISRAGIVLGFRNIVLLIFPILRNVEIVNNGHLFNFLLPLWHIRVSSNMVYLFNFFDLVDHEIVYLDWTCSFWLPLDPSFATWQFRLPSSRSCADSNPIDNPSACCRWLAGSRSSRSICWETGCGERNSKMEKNGNEGKKKRILEHTSVLMV